MPKTGINLHLWAILQEEESMRRVRKAEGITRYSEAKDLIAAAHSGAFGQLRAAWKTGNRGAFGSLLRDLAVLELLIGVRVIAVAASLGSREGAWKDHALRFIKA